MVDELSNNKVANVNLIFTAKAAYGMRETSPIPAGEIEQKKVLTAAELPRLGDMAEDRCGDAMLPCLTDTEPDKAAE